MVIYAVAIAMHVHCNSCIHKPVCYIIFVASIFSKVSCILYVCRCYVAVSVANGNPSFHNEHTACTCILKVSNIPEVAVEFECYRTKFYIYSNEPRMYSQYGKNVGTLVQVLYT